MARAVAFGNARIINSLESGGFVRMAGDASFNGRPDVVLVVGGSGSAAEIAPDAIDIPFMEELASLNVRVIGCEASTAKASCVPQYKACGVTTVDDLDSAAGRLATVLALGGAEGHFGTKDSADQLFPQIGTSGGQ